MNVLLGVQPPHPPQVNKLDFMVWCASFFGVLFAGIEIGLGIAIGLAVLIVIYESAFPHTALLGRIPGTGVYRNVKQYPQVGAAAGTAGPVQDQGGGGRCGWCGGTLPL